MWSNGDELLLDLKDLRLSAGRFFGLDGLEAALGWGFRVSRRGGGALVRRGCAVGGQGAQMDKRKSFKSGNGSLSLDHALPRGKGKEVKGKHQQQEKLRKSGVRNPLL